MTPDWFPDWSGETCIIVASGPSAAAVPLEQAKGKAKIIAINDSWRLCPWADVLYGCDVKWWQQNKGLPGFAGMRLAGEKRAAEDYNGIHHIRVMHFDDRLHLDEKGTVGCGGNSGFQALNLALQFGCTRIILVGYDMRLDKGLHWHGAHPKELDGGDYYVT
mgnify:CR=1 FL=1